MKKIKSQVLFLFILAAIGIVVLEYIPSFQEQTNPNITEAIDYKNVPEIKEIRLPENLWKEWM